MEKKKNYYKLKVDLYRGEKILKVFGSSDKNEQSYQIVLHTDHNRSIVIDIKE